MKTYLAKAGEIERKHVVFDAAGIPLGRLAVKIANALRGKDKPTYTPHVDTGIYAIVINAEKVLLTGSKNVKKEYEKYTGYRSGRKMHFTKSVGCGADSDFRSGNRYRRGGNGVCRIWYSASGQ